MKSSAELQPPANREPLQSSTGSSMAPWLFASAAILCSFALTRIWHWESQAGRLSDQGAAARPEASGESLQVWQGELELESGGRLLCVLAPFHAEASLQRFRSEQLASRWGLATGQLLRVILTHEGEREQALVISGFEVQDAEGRCLGDLAPLLPTEHEPDSLLTLIARRGANLEAGESEQIMGWGRPPGQAARLILRLPEGSLELPLEAQGIHGESLPRSFAEEHLEAEPRETASSAASQAGSVATSGTPSMQAGFQPREELLERIAGLQAALLVEKARVQELQQARVAREEEILRFTTLVSGLPLPTQVRSNLGLETQPVEPLEAEPAPEPLAPDPALLRAEEVKLALRTLLTLEGLYALDLLEVGELHPPVSASEGLDEAGQPVEIAAQAGWVGPVLFRLLDPLGRLDGSLHAARLHLEGSRASRTLHVILREGYESHQGQRMPFEGGERRISLPLVDPEPWIDRLPELFSPRELQPENDDGRWDLGALRLEMNSLLGQGSQAGWYRIHGFGGVMQEEFVEVQLQEFDSRGHLRRRLFADRMRLRLDASGVSLELIGGASADADGMHPFRDGRHSIFLPAADEAEWRTHRLPGLAPLAPPEPERAPAAEPEVEPGAETDPEMP